MALVTAPVLKSLGSLPTELLLDIIDHLSTIDKKSLRCASRFFKSFCHGMVDASIFSTLNIRLTTRSFNTLAEIANNPTIASYVTTLVHGTNRLRKLDDYVEFDKLIKEGDRVLPKTSRLANLLGEEERIDAHAEYMKLYWEQQRLIRKEPTLLESVLRKFPNLQNVVIANEMALRPTLGSEFIVGATPHLDKVDVSIFNDAKPVSFPVAWLQVNIPKTQHSTHTFCTIATAVARAQVPIRKFEVRSSAGILGKVVYKSFSLEEIAKGLSSCQELMLAIDTRGFCGYGQLYPSPEYHLGDVTSEILTQATSIRKLKLYFHGNGLGMVRCLNLKELVPEGVYRNLEELSMHYLEVKATGLVRFFREYSPSLRKLTIGNILLLDGSGGWSYVMNELKEMVRSDFRLEITSSLCEEGEFRPVFVSPSKATKMLGGEDDAYVESY